jgi:hypothetical protein
MRASLWASGVMLCASRPETEETEETEENAPHSRGAVDD